MRQLGIPGSPADALNVLHRYRDAILSEEPAPNEARRLSRTVVYAALPNYGEALTEGYRLQLPYSKTRGYFFLVSLGMLATLISSVLDHAHTNFSNPWLWLTIP